ncbi:hypothetical protein [Rhodopirellula baltica]|uniref:hypothetical protein n=1 Tax=Rhodopirellula baltica TaxID=265606 RepID=UPI001875ECCE|nr:hypothetical protein [Rhodopirellula baltica]
MAYQLRLAFFQSIGTIAMYNMAYRRDCKIDIAIWQLPIVEPVHVGQVPPGNGCMPVSDPLAMAHKSRLALYQSIGKNAMYNMACKRLQNRHCKLAIADQ